ncbi:MAG TPA: serine hydrolase domain-containing protein [Actinomycetales bacterium]|nr:serine hydrolase domain-containing protein [Actinomycetales bacterium]
MNTHGLRGTDVLLTSRLTQAASATKGRHTPALSFAVASTGGLHAVGAVGIADLATARPASTRDQYPWFSMTKIATATAASRLAAAGRLDLDAAIDTFLPGYHAGRHQTPTVRQLLTHTAGLSNPLPIRWVRPAGRPADTSLVDTITAKHGAPRRAPGQRAAYSNIGYLLVGRVLEAVTSQRLEQAIADLVLDPLGMTETGFDFDHDRPRATGYVRAPRLAHPLLKWLLPAGIVGDRVGDYSSLRPFLVEGAAYGGLIGPASDAVKLATAHLSDTSPLGDLQHMRSITQRGKPFDQGIGWFRKPADADRTPAFVEHYGTGGGFWNAMRIYPDLGVAIVAMTNNTAAWPYHEFFTRVVDAYRQHDPPTG